ncbi:hypothetical protein EV189_1639 [Motilibacter rhizosphaerae]|uniref:Uncharacterized protein n=1 Tax=Motilibacter rhizosphaerae TaxID=598652 RepID=A0A4Q7NRY0_9ACTN|nr:hypothetical protein [Motilibacter rhizosphaerae]RZS89863.1 hypothetical protein EV189_1639 [Motilibacter rhizosphaerae]
MLRRLVTLLALGTLGVLPVVQATSAQAAGRQRAVTTSSASAPGRAMWLWTRDDPATVVAFARAHGVTELYAAVPPALATSPALPWARRLSAKAHAAGLRVAALGGDPGWLADPAGARAWMTAATATGLFDGVHVDVEPYLLPGWDSDRAGTVAAYLALLGSLHAASPLPLTADVPFWLDGVDAGRAGPRLDVAVLARVDGVVVMSYRTTAAGVLAVGAATLAAAASAGKPARLALETNATGEGGTSLAGRSAAELAGIAAAVDAGAAGSAAYAGIAVEDYRGWAALRA